MTNLVQLKEIAEKARKDADVLADVVKDVYKLIEIQNGEIKLGDWK